MNQVLGIARQINTIRRRRKMSMQALAESIGVSQPTVSRMLAGRQTISLAQLDSIARILKVHPFALWTDQPLNTSRLLPFEGGISPRLLGLMLGFYRLRARLSRSEAARSLHLDEAELKAVETSLADPDNALLERCATLYQQDYKELLALAEFERAAPNVSGQLAAAHRVVLQMADLFKGRDPLELRGVDKAQFSRLWAHCLEFVDELLAGEPSPMYYAIGHISDTLLAALQDVDFHRQMEALAEEWARKPENANRVPEEKKHRQHAAEARPYALNNPDPDPDD